MRSRIRAFWRRADVSGQCRYSRFTFILMEGIVGEAINVI